MKDFNKLYFFGHYFTKLGHNQSLQSFQQDFFSMAKKLQQSYWDYFL